jgi:hypothetical protein
VSFPAGTALPVLEGAGTAEETGPAEEAGLDGAGAELWQAVSGASARIAAAMNAVMRCFILDSSF